MNATKAKELLSPIPKEDFIISAFSDGKGKCCAIGHLVRLQSEDPKDYVQFLGEGHNTPIYSFARVYTRKFLEKYHKVYSRNLASVNNSDSINGYTEDNPKDRIMHLLDDMIEKGY